MSYSEKYRAIVEAFNTRSAATVKVAGLVYNGSELILYGNRIAWRVGRTIHVQASGFGSGSRGGSYYSGVRRDSAIDHQDEMSRGNYHRSPFTLHILGLIVGVDVYRHRCKTVLNGQEWDGMPTPLRKPSKKLQTAESQDSTV